MSDTQGSHRRGGSVPEAYEAQPLSVPAARAAGTGDPGPAAWHPEPQGPVPVPTTVPVPTKVPVPNTVPAAHQ
ncbi:histidinol-phosphate aminotransferase family protein, partial [Streptomyces nojiriensis]